MSPCVSLQHRHLLQILCRNVMQMQHEQATQLAASTFLEIEPFGDMSHNKYELRCHLLTDLQNMVSHFGLRVPRDFAKSE